MSTTAEKVGDHYVLNGEKLWCTNGTLAELLVVMARDTKTKKISAFIVETDWEGVKVEYRCRFMGLRALGNGVVSFSNVRVPRENLLWDDVRGDQRDADLFSVLAPMGSCHLICRRLRNTVHFVDKLIERCARAQL